MWYKDNYYVKFYWSDFIVFLYLNQLLFQGFRLPHYLSIHEGSTDGFLSFKKVLNLMLYDSSSSFTRNISILKTLNIVISR